MKPTSSDVGSKGKSTISSRVSIDTEKLLEAIAVLEAADFEVKTAPVELWQHRCLLTAYHPQTSEGYLIGSDELGLICHYGAGYLNPHGYGDSCQARYADKNNSHRVRHYAEAVIARAVNEIQSAQVGSRNQTLSKAAYTIGRYLLGWQLNPDSIQGQLLEAALSAGLDYREAITTIKRGLEAGQRNSRDPNELLDEVVSGRPRQAVSPIEEKHLSKLRAKIGGHR